MPHQVSKDGTIEIKYEKKSTDQELVDFLRSPLYEDFCAIAEQRKSLIMQGLATADSMEKVNRLQGELSGLQFWEHFPTGLLKAIVEEKEHATETPDE